MINPGSYNFTIYTSKSLNMTFTWSANGTPINLTGYAARCFFRASVTDTNPLISLTSDVSGGIILGTTNGQITLAGTPTQTALLVGNPTVVYDLELTDTSGSVFTILHGICQVVESVTR